MKIEPEAAKANLQDIVDMQNKWKKEDKERIKNSHSWELVISDMVARDYLGAVKYHKYLTPGTNEDMLQHLYEELLDAAVYIKTLIVQRELKDE